MQTQEAKALGKLVGKAMAGTASAAATVWLTRAPAVSLSARSAVCTAIVGIRSHG